jgi:uncharacterized RDD family membrane protein YckC
MTQDCAVEGCNLDMTALEPVAPRAAADELHPVLVLREARSFDGLRAGIVTRFAAAALDGTLVALVVAIGYGAVIGVVFLWNPAHFDMPSLPFWGFLVVTGVLMTAYLSVCWATTGRTYGDLVMAVRVVDRHGHHPSFPLALLRAVLCVLVPLGLFYAAVNRRNRSLQDVVLRTSTIYYWHGPALPAPRHDHLG